MPRDYKNTTQRVSRPFKRPGIDGWDRFLIVTFITLAALVIRFSFAPQAGKMKASFGSLFSTQSLTEPEQQASLVAKMPDEQQAALRAQQIAVEAKAKAESEAKKPLKQDNAPQEPHFDFYTILPSLEVVIPDHEIKTRIREEKIAAKAKADAEAVALENNGILPLPPTLDSENEAKYIMQAGSFRDVSDAERIKKKLFDLGVASRIEKAQVGEVVWHRIKIGPYSGMTTVMAVKTRLRENGVDTLVLEFNQ